MAVEHILPKDPPLGYAHLKNEWTNFLLSCVNCNSSKGTEVITLSDYLLPDRDNTFPYFEYLETGQVNAIGDPAIQLMAQNTLDLVSLNSIAHRNWDDTIAFSALERFSQRVQAWVQAKEAKIDYDAGEVNVRRIGAEAASTGFFSIWMAAFHNAPAVRSEFIRIFSHTAANCFNANTDPITPRPANGLDNSGKA